jgi:MFS family permease
MLGLNAANFFQAEMVGVVLPVLNALLKDAHWPYGAIGVATAAAGLGTLIFQTPAGMIVERVVRRRELFAAMAILTGICFSAVPLVPHSRVAIDTLLFVAGAAQSLFVPLLAALALALVGRQRLNRTIGANQGWNHAGNVVAALAAMGLVSLVSMTSIFYAVGVASMLAAISVFLIRTTDIDRHRATGLQHHQPTPQASSMALLLDRGVATLFVSILLFHVANAPILPTVALYVKQLHGSDTLMTATVLSAQVIMIPVSLLAGVCSDRWSAKSVMGVAVWVLPLRILSYSCVHTPQAVVALQTLDGVGAGIYGVAVVALSADLARTRGRFNTLMGLFATALALGGVLGPLVSGLLLQSFGFAITFRVFALIGAAGAVLFTALMPAPTRRASRQTRPLAVA